MFRKILRFYKPKSLVELLVMATMVWFLWLLSLSPQGKPSLSWVVVGGFFGALVGIPTAKGVIYLIRKVDKFLDGLFNGVMRQR